MKPIRNQVGMRYRQLYVFILFLSPFSGYAQTLSLFDAIAMSTANYPLLQQRRAEVAAGSAHVIATNSRRLPNLTLQDQFDFGTNNALQGTYLTYGMVPSASGTTNSSVQNNRLNPNNVLLSYLQWNVYNFGYYNALMEEARARLAINEANLGNDQYLLTENIISLYLDWLKKYRLLQIQNENVTRAGVK